MDTFISEGKSAANRVGSFFKNAFQKFEDKILDKKQSSTDVTNQQRSSINESKQLSQSQHVATKSERKKSDPYYNDSLNPQAQNHLVNGVKKSKPIRRQKPEIDYNCDKIEEIIFHHPVSNGQSSKAYYNSLLNEDVHYSDQANREINFDHNIGF